MSECVVEFDGVHKAYRFFELHDVSLRLEPGQIMGLVGPNGAGKSTTIRILMSLVQQDRGSVRVLGHPMPADQAAAKRDMSPRTRACTAPRRWRGTCISWPEYIPPGIRTTRGFSSAGSTFVPNNRSRVSRTDPLRRDRPVHQLLDQRLRISSGRERRLSADAVARRLFFPLPKSLESWVVIWPAFHLNQIGLAVANVEGFRFFNPLMSAVVLAGITVLFGGLAIRRLATRGQSRTGRPKGLRYDCILMADLKVCAPATAVVAQAFRPAHRALNRDT